MFSFGRLMGFLGEESSSDGTLVERVLAELSASPERAGNRRTM